MKENIVNGDDVDLFDFPAPHWNRVDGGRYMHDLCRAASRKHPDTDVMNVGVYRGMVADRNHISDAACTAPSISAITRRLAAEGREGNADRLS